MCLPSNKGLFYFLLPSSLLYIRTAGACPYNPKQHHFLFCIFLFLLFVFLSAEKRFTAWCDRGLPGFLFASRQAWRRAKVPTPLGTPLKLCTRQGRIEKAEGNVRKRVPKHMRSCFVGLLCINLVLSESFCLNASIIRICFFHLLVARRLLQAPRARVRRACRQVEENGHR